MFKDRRTINIILFIMWLICGIFTITMGINKGGIPVVPYICLWVCYLTELALKD